MRDNVMLLAGVAAPDRTPWVPFADETLDFLSALSHSIRSSGARRQEDVAALGFWCRRARLETLAARHCSPHPRLGRGLVFHLAPSNVPTMFAYSLVIGLLAGNANVVRLSQRRGQTEEILCGLMRDTLERPEFYAVKARTALLSYERDEEKTREYMATCDARVIWGGDATVAAMRRLPMPPHGVELCFPDRWSLALLCPSALARMSRSDLADLAHRFYNDTYLMDQNACSSPQLALWLENGGDPMVRRRWWEAVAAEAESRYSLDPFRAARKYERLCLAAMAGEGFFLSSVTQYGGNILSVAALDGLPMAPAELKGGFGLFFEGVLPNLDALLPLLSHKVQTVSCAGLEPGAVAHFLARSRAQGVDRVVPVGQAMEMDTIWDGKDLIAALSRIITS